MKAWLRSAAIVGACFLAEALAAGTIFGYTHERFAPAAAKAWVTDAAGFAFQVTGYAETAEMPPEDALFAKAIPGAVFLVIRFNVKAPGHFDGLPTCSLRLIGKDGQQWRERGVGESTALGACNRAMAAQADPVVVGYTFFQIPESARADIVGVAVDYSLGFAATPVMVYQ